MPLKNQEGEIVIAINCMAQPQPQKPTTHTYTQKTEEEVDFCKMKQKHNNNKKNICQKHNSSIKCLRHNLSHYVYHSLCPLVWFGDIKREGEGNFEMYTTITNRTVAMVKIIN